MLRWVLICVVASWAAVAKAGEVDANGVPIPDDINIVSSKSVPNSMRRFIGAWFGTWASSEATMKHILIVERLHKDGRAEVIYAWGDRSDGSLRRGWERVGGTVKGNVLTLDANRATYQFLNAQRISVRIGPEGSPVVMRRYPIFLWLRNSTPQAGLPPNAGTALAITLIGKTDGAKSCNLLLRFQNRLGLDLDSGEFEIFVLKAGGLPLSSYRLVTPQLPSGSNKKVKFELPMDCRNAQAVAGNGFTLCRGKEDYLAQCNSALVLSSSIVVSFSDEAE